MSRIGFLVNPIAGMGGAVGLKGTDGEKILREAVRRGAKHVSPDRARRFLEMIPHDDKRISLMIAPGTMGGSIATQLNLPFRPIGRIGKVTTSRYTVLISRMMKHEKVDLIVFCGGDGTARDVLEGVGRDTPVLGVPSGVKIYSSVFAINPVAAAETADAFLKGQLSTKLGEVVDVDESAYQKNKLSVKLFGYLTIPDSGRLLQESKSAVSTESADLDGIAAHVTEGMAPEWSYFLCPGSTVERIAERLGIKKTLLGVDAVKGNGRLLGSDLDESRLLDLTRQGPVKIIVSPIGGQGFLFGRGNQQVSPKVIRAVGVENIIVVGSREKIEGLHPRRLLVDSGDEDIDRQLRGFVRIVTGYREEMVVRVE